MQEDLKIWLNGIFPISAHQNTFSIFSRKCTKQKNCGHETIKDIAEISFEDSKVLTLIISQYCLC